MAREPSQKLVDYGIIAGILFGAYAVWSFVFKVEEKKCPLGQHAVNPCEGQIGWPATLCNLGRQITGAALDCKPDITNGGGCVDVGGVACKAGGGKWTEAGCICDITGCAVNPQTCINSGMKLDPVSCTCVTDLAHQCGGKNDFTEAQRLTAKLNAGECFTVEEIEWARTCEPYLFTRMIQCKSSEQLCVESCNYAPTQHAKENCQADCRGLPWPWPVTPSVPVSNIVDCSCGKIDLNNPPGLTCEIACKDWVAVPVPVPVPGIHCYAGGYSALANRPGNCGGSGLASEKACIALCGGGSTYYPENGSCVSAGQKELDAYRDACGWM